jgi:large subunit ribosomal protein L4
MANIKKPAAKAVPSTKTTKKATTPVKAETTVTVKPVTKVTRGVKIDVLDLTGKVQTSIDLPAELFGAKVNKQIMAQAVRVYLANQRQGTQSTKTRGEVTGSTRKIYRQKGTGRARHGGITAPIFVGGGIALGPKPRDYGLSLPKKMRRVALASALTSQLNAGKVKVVDGFDTIEPKTKVL